MVVVHVPPLVLRSERSSFGVHIAGAGFLRGEGEVFSGWEGYCL